MINKEWISLISSFLAKQAPKCAQCFTNDSTSLGTNLRTSKASNFGIDHRVPEWAEHMNFWVKMLVPIIIWRSIVIIIRWSIGPIVRRIWAITIIGIGHNRQNQQQNSNTREFQFLHFRQALAKGMMRSGGEENRIEDWRWLRVGERPTGINLRENESDDCRWGKSKNADENWWIGVWGPIYGTWANSTSSDRFCEVNTVVM